jgi:hypothetical protein
MSRPVVVSKELLEAHAFNHPGAEIEFTRDRAFLTIGNITFVALLDVPTNDRRPVLLTAESAAA